MKPTVIITGSEGGIGNALCLKFEDAGWNVIGIDRKPHANRKSYTYYRCDLGNSKQVQNLIRTILVSKPNLRALIHNAARKCDKTFLKTSDQEWSDLFAVNLDAIFWLSKGFASRLADGGSIIAISSVHARSTSFGAAAYAASKGALSALTRAMAIELGVQGTRVNAILPGAIDTKMLRNGLKATGNFKKALSRSKASSPVNRIGDPNDVAELALFLANPASSGNITGQELVCDGGVLARLPSE